MATDTQARHQVWEFGTVREVDVFGYLDRGWEPLNAFVYEGSIYVAIRRKIIVGGGVSDEH